MNKIDNDILEILNTECNNDDYVSNIRYLLNANILSKNEEELCEEMLHQIEYYHKTDLIKALNNLELCTDDVDNIKQLNYSFMFVKIDDLIKKRYEEENKKILADALNSSVNSNYNEKALDVFFNRYASTIEIEKDSIFEDLILQNQNKTEETISSACEYIDEVTGGILVGSLTTIVGTNDNYKSIWALNIAYKCLKENLNVLYISLGQTKEEIYKHFLSRHSKDSKFEKPISLNEVNSTDSKKLFQKVYDDFKNFLFDNLIIYDSTHLCISTQYSLQKLLVYAQNEFIHKTDKGIDVIIIDDFSNMTIDDGKRTITNKSRIINTYFKYLKQQSQHLLGTNKKVPVIVTISCDKNHIIELENYSDFSINFVDDEVKALSDNIFSTYGNYQLRRNNTVKLKVLKSLKETMYESKAESVDIVYWHMKYGKFNNDDEAHKDDLIKELKQENQNLEQRNKESSQQIMDLIEERSKPKSDDEFTNEINQLISDDEYSLYETVRNLEL